MPQDVYQRSNNIIDKYLRVWQTRIRKGYEVRHNNMYSEMCKRA